MADGSVRVREIMVEIRVEEDAAERWRHQRSGTGSVLTNREGLASRLDRRTVTSRCEGNGGCQGASNDEVRQWLSWGYSFGWGQWGARERLRQLILLHTCFVCAARANAIPVTAQSKSHSSVLVRLGRDLHKIPDWHVRRPISSNHPIILPFLEHRL